MPDVGAIGDIDGLLREVATMFADALKGFENQDDIGGVADIARILQYEGGEAAQG